MTTTPESTGTRRSRWLIAALLAAVVLGVVLILGFATPGFWRTPKMKVGDVEHGVKSVLTDDTAGYGVKNVGDVTCNNGQDPTAAKGGHFECQVTVDGAKRTVTVTMTDNAGAFAVGRPK